VYVRAAGIAALVAILVALLVSAAVGSEGTPVHRCGGLRATIVGAPGEAVIKR
jgi:hypothetical protein